jgi:nicotinamidase-related amidase
MTNTGLILIDIQNDYFPDFPDPKMPLPHMRSAANNAAQLLVAACATVDIGFKVTIVHDACAAANVHHNGVSVPADNVQAAIMAPLTASHTAVLATAEYL